MPNIMFWNVKNGSALSRVPVACFENDIDILILAEDDSESGYVEKLLNSHYGCSLYSEFRPVKSKIKFYHKTSSKLGILDDDGDRISIRNCTFSDNSSIIIAGVHLRSKLYATSTDQALIARKLRNSIDRVENILGHQRSIIIGDFNMNPFEEGMVAHDALHSVMTKQIALRKNRTFDGVSSPYFYNPMWNYFGDDSPGPPGTYFYSSGKSMDYYWNMFDQILLRPSILEWIPQSSVSILSKIGTESLVSDNKIEGSSDHLPVILKMHNGDAS